MGNTFITPLVVAKLAIPALLKNWVFAGLVHRDYAKEFKKVGNSVRVRRPATFTAIEFDGDLEGAWQKVTETYLDVLMDTVITVPIEFTQVEQSLDIVNFNMQVVEPAMQALAQKVDEKLALLYKDIPYIYTLDHSAAGKAVASLLGARKIQNDNKVPFDKPRFAVMSPLTTAALLAEDAFRDLDKTGVTKALREASLGKIFGYEFYENQNIQTHSYTAAEPAGTVVGEHAKGATTLAVTSHGAGTITKGTIVTIADNTGQYVVTADCLLVATAGTLSIYPALNALIATGKVSTLHAAATTSKENLMAHKNAFALVTAPMAPPIGGATGATVTYKGLAINVVYSYQHGKFQNRMTCSILCGFKTLTPELAVRFYEES